MGDRMDPIIEMVLEQIAEKIGSDVYAVRKMPDGWWQAGTPDDIAEDVNRAAVAARQPPPGMELATSWDGDPLFRLAP